jgi:putative transposase
MRRTHSPEFKAQIVLAILKEEHSISQLASQHGLHPNLLYRWRDEALAGLPGLLSDRRQAEQVAREAAQAAELERLFAQIGRLTTELDWLKKKLPS